MARSPERISSVAGTCWAAARPSASRMRASTSAGPAVSSTTSSRPQSAATAASPPSETTASSGAEAPVVRRRQEAAVSSPALAAAQEMTLLTTDGDRLAARHLPRVVLRAQMQDSFDIGVVVAHGFTGSIDKPGVLAVCAAITQHAGVLA